MPLTLFRVSTNSEKYGEWSKFHGKHGNYEPVKCISHESVEKVENKERVKHNFGSFHGVTENVGTVDNTVQSVEILGFPRKTWKISQKDFARMWKAWKIKICILDNAIASNFISVDGRGEILTKDSTVYWSSLLPAKNPSFL